MEGLKTIKMLLNWNVKNILRKKKKRFGISKRRFELALPQPGNSGD